MLIFDITTIYVGVCLPKIARQFNFANLEKPSHGGYVINSKGKAFHTKLPEINNVSSGFSFGEGDEISVWIDFASRTVNFCKKGKIKDSLYSMDLALEDKFMYKLRGFVAFGGEKGAKVMILPLEEPPMKKKKK